MLVKKRLQGDIDFFSNLQILAQTYVEVAAARVQSVRTQVVHNRGFLDDLARLYKQIKESYHHELVLLTLKRKQGARFGWSIVKKNEKSAYVFIASNAGLFGDIVPRVFSLFLEKIKEEKTPHDIFIVGRVGKRLWEESHFPGNPISLDFPDDKFDMAEFKDMSEKLVTYEKVMVFYGQFENIISQLPVVNTITGNEALVGKAEGPKISYFFEPSIMEIVEFFEREIFSSLLVQTIDESQLSKQASRMVYMDKASDVIFSKLKATRLAKQRLSHYLLNKKQREAMAGFTLWNTT